MRIFVRVCMSVYILETEGDCASVHVDVFASLGSPKGTHFATASYDRTACLYGPRGDDAWTLLHRFHFRGTAEAIAFSPDGAYVVLTARDDNYLHYVRVEDGAVARYNMNENGDDFVSFVAMDGGSLPPSPPPSPHAC
jgi:WD40 repeat protein